MVKQLQNDNIKISILTTIILDKMKSANLLTVTALYDSSLNFYPSGKQFTIQADSQVLGTKTLPTSQHIPGAVHYVPEAPLLVVKSVDFGDLYLNLTISQYFAFDG